MNLRIRAGDIHLLELQTRMPFKYGIATMTECPHAFVRLGVTVDGKAASGIAADHLPPKWFTKNPQTHAKDDIADMIECIRTAVSHAQAAGECANIFELWLKTYNAQKVWAATKGFPPLLWNFGVSLVERAASPAKPVSWPALRDNLNTSP